MSVLFERCRRTGVAELHRVMLEVGRCKSLVVVVEPVHIVDSEEGHSVVVGIGLEAVVLRKIAVGVEDSLAAVDLGYGVEVHMAAAEVEGIPLVVGGMDYVKELRMVVGVHILPAAAVKEAADQILLSHLADSLRVGHRSDLLAHILEGARENRHSPAGVDNPVVGMLEEGIDLTGAAGILLPSSESVGNGRRQTVC